MLVTFTCESYGKLIFFGNVARHLIKLMGHSDNIPGAIKAEEVEQALNNLLAGLNQTNKNAPLPRDKEDEPPISLATRAVPLIDMLKSAQKHQSDIIWQ
ncbi:Domain of uncharacterised function (DUF1840) [Legionella beliardensis]|uniref:Domain of uncharacterized function (DUF1840) n=1 Tax=Legionella beliardensis TaxID=91822 RepID=A0A378I226_9GAMM|nr:DUF1840 domain-containing protein [Legionella beliardensis]STX29002.1 Domain of uncharacterised function (DUF1840) [Legionella beliardensis]